jgi:small GTP-binding protein
MADLNDVVKGLPSETGEIIKTVWDKMPDQERGKLQALVSQIPVDSRISMLIGLVEKEFKLAFGKKNTVAIIGPANVGKSTLFNQFISSKAERAEVSPIPGTTKIIQRAETGLFTMADTPGADAVGETGDQERSDAMDAAEAADFLVIMFDAVQGIKLTEMELFRELTSLGTPYIVVMNKVDLVSKDRDAVISRAAHNLGLQAKQIIPVSAKSGKNLENIVMAIAVAEPEIVAALGKALPAFRWQLAWRSIIGAASAAGLVGLIPLPFIDFIPLVVIQSAMVIAIARIYNYRITPMRAIELVFTFGIGFLGRTLFSEISKLVGIPGWLLAAVIAASVTVAMGYAAAIWFERGEKLTAENLKTISQVIAKNLLKSVKSLGRKKPTGDELKQSIMDALNQSQVMGEQKHNTAGETPEANQHQ